jgi:hypothetical protein
MPADAESRAHRSWRIVARPLNDRGDAVFDVYQGDQRRAWGLKDKATAERWMSRLASPGDTLEPEGASAESGDTSEDGDDGSAVIPRRVWWNEG